jgi:hypothetical protein
MLKLLQDIQKDNILDALYLWNFMKQKGVYTFACTPPIPFESQTNNSSSNPIPSVVINTCTLVSSNPWEQMALEGTKYLIEQGGRRWAARRHRQSVPICEIHGEQHSFSWAPVFAYG